MKDDAGLRLARLARMASPHKEEALRAAAMAEGLLLRRIRLPAPGSGAPDWRNEDLGLLIVFLKGEENAAVLDTRGGHTALLHADGRRSAAPEATDVLPEALALVAPKARTMPGWQEAIPAILTGLAINAPAAALITQPSPGKATAGLAVLAGSGALALLIRQTAALRRIGLAGLASSSAIWLRLAHAAPAQLNRPSPAGMAERLGALVTQAIEDSLRKSGRISALGLAVPALGLLAAASPAALSAAGLLLLPALALRASLTRRIFRQQEECQRRSNALQEIAAETAAALPRLRLLGRGDWLMRRVADAQGAWQTVSRWQSRLEDLRSALDRLLICAVPLASCIAAEQSALTDNSQPLVLAGIALAAACLTQAGLMAGRVAPERRIEQPEWLTNGEGGHSGSLTPGSIRQIACEGLSFHYPDAPGPVLQNANLTLRRGEVLGLTGPSGCGKSTLIQLLLGFQKPESGSIRVDGELLERLDPASYRRRIGCVFQDESISLDTIRAVVLGMAPLRDEAIARALRITGLDEEVATLPMGVQTLVAEGMVSQNLVQRLLIARAVAREPDFLILDETVTGLDQDQISRLLASLRKDGTGMLIVTHNPAILAQTDAVVQLGISDMPAVTV
ncbi:ATP-binding cassette domain-containing protein [Pannonibacter phragmitetus]|uniref:ATP-binding cassette domain-containing protein n=1 Tax=Pannonibacter phragmitetus TaxID=121719 RepID=UPI003D2EA52A